MAKTQAEKDADKAAAKAATQANKAAKVEELNAPLVKDPVASDVLLNEAEFERADYDALDADAQKAFMIDWGAIDADGNVLKQEYVQADVVDATNGTQAADVGNGDKTDTTLDAGQTEVGKGVDSGIVNRQGSEDGDAAVIETDSKGAVKKAVNTAGKDAGKLTDDSKGPKDENEAEEVHVRPAHELDQPRDKDEDAKRLKRVAVSSDVNKKRSADEWVELILKRLDTIESKLDTLDKEGEVAKAALSTLMTKVFDKDTLHGSLESLKKVL